MAHVSPEKQREFAVEVVRRLRAAGFEACWAGGCVRDRLLGRTPADYDVATAAAPDEVRRVFGARRTVPVGVAFGVVTVLGPAGAGQVEVATFRSDGAYSDGRRPDRVAFSSAREDAARRDFTINGLFYDPLDDRVIDFVGGQDDLARRVLRAIGDPRERFAEDKLRLLRAVRFAARLDFALDPATFAAVRAMAPEIAVVSPERIADEMRKMLVDRGRAAAARLLAETGLGAEVLPEAYASRPLAADGASALGPALELLDALAAPSFPAALAALLWNAADAAAAEAVGRRWRLSNAERERTVWLLERRDALRDARAAPWSKVQKTLAAEGIGDLLTIHEAESRLGRFPEDLAAWCRSLVEGPRERLDPPPLLTGDDLQAHGLRPGPAFRDLLLRVRDAQLDGAIHTKSEALALVDRTLAAAR